MPGVLVFSFNIVIASLGSLSEVKESNMIVTVYTQYKVFSVMIMKSLVFSIVLRFFGFQND